MRVARRSHLSRIASDDDWFQDSWWEDGKVAPADSRERREALNGPHIAGHGSGEPPGGSSRESPMIDPRITKGALGGRTGKREKKQR